MFPGAIAHKGLIFTSGVVHPAVFDASADEPPDAREQITVALDEVLRFVSEERTTERIGRGFRA